MKYLTTMKNEHGAGIIEYTLVVALIAITSVSTVSLIGNSTSDTLNEASEDISHAGNVPPDESSTTEPGDATTTTVSSGSDDSEDGGDSGGPASTTTTTAPATTTTTTVAPTTTTTAPDYPTATTGVDGEFSVVFGYQDGKVTIVSTDSGSDWSYDVKSQKKNRVTIEWTNETSDESYETTGFYKKGKLDTEIA